MHLTAKLVFVVAVALPACSKEGDLVAPGSDGAALAGLGVTASAIVGSVIMVEVTLTNVSAQRITRSYPAGCPVLVRLYRAPDQVLVYDEGRRPCGVTTPVSFSLDPQQSMVLSSGFRVTTTVTGDSISSGDHDVAALLRITGMNPIEFAAGRHRVPSCNPETGTCS